MVEMIAFTKGFQGFPETVRLYFYLARYPPAQSKEIRCFPNGFGGVFFLGQGVFSWPVVLDPFGT